LERRGTGDAKIDGSQDKVLRTSNQEFEENRYKVLVYSAHSILG